MSIKKFSKQPSEILDYDVDFGPWLAGRADPPTSHEVIVPTGITLVADTRTEGVVKVVLSGGGDGERYVVTVRLTTQAGLVKETEFVVAVKEI